MYTFLKTKMSGLIALSVIMTASVAWAQDADGDGLTDADEMNVYMSNPSLIDTDGDGLTDSEEVLQTLTSPTMRDTDGGGVEDHVELILGTDPTVMADDAPQQTPLGLGAMATWSFGVQSITTLAQAQALSIGTNSLGSRTYLIPGPINYSNQPLPGPHGPFANHTTVQDVWGMDQNNFSVVFSGMIYVPPATQSNPTNVHTFAVSSDEGFSLSVFDGSAVQNAQLDMTRTMGTGPLLAVDFPDQGGLFPISLLGWDGLADTTSGIKLSWAPGQQMTFSEAQFSLIPTANFIAPALTSTQTIVDDNGGQIEVGDFLTVTVTLENTGQSAAYDLSFQPSTIIGARFDAYVTTPASATVSRTSTPPTVQIPVLNQASQHELSYKIVVEQNNVRVQGQWRAFATAGSGPFAVLTDDASGQDALDTGNAPAALFAQGLSDDDLNVVTVGDDLIDPTLEVEVPAQAQNIQTPSPVFYGKTEPNATVTLLLDGATTIMLTADITGFWHHQFVGLSAGQHTLSVSAVDAAANASPTIMRNWTLSGTLDIIPTNPLPGVYTNTAQPDYRGTTAPGASVKIETFDETGMLQDTATVVADLNGEYQHIPPFTLLEGAQRVVITSTLAQVSSVLVYPFTVDVFAPIIRFTSPTQMQTITRAQPTLYGTTEPFASVMVRIDMQAFVMRRANAQGQWQHTVTMPLTDGPHIARAEAVDLASNAGTFTLLNFSVDTTPPPITITSPMENAYVSTGSVTIRGTTEPNATVYLSIDGAEAVIVQANDQGNWNYRVSPALMDGPHEATAYAQDAVGNKSAPVTRAFNIDATDPTITITSPQENDVTGPKPTITGTAEIGSTVQLKFDDGPRLDVTLDAQGMWMRPTVTPLAHGAHSVTAYARDLAGNEVNDKVNFLVDARAPNIAITTPMQDDELIDPTPTVTGTSDANTTIFILVNGKEVGQTTSDANGDWSFDVPTSDPLQGGPNTIEAQARDDQGNTAKQDIDVTLNTNNPVVIVTPEDNDEVSAKPTVTGTANGEVEVEIFVDGQKVGSTTSDGEGNWTFTFDMALDTGKRDIEAKDGVVTDKVTVTVSATQIVTIDSPTTGQTISDATPTISGSAPPNAVVIICIDGQEVGQTTADANGNWTFTLPDDKALKAGERTIEAKSKDGAGTPIQSAPVVVTFNEDAWDVTVTSPTANAKVDTTFTITGKTKPGALVTVFIDGEKRGEVTADDEGNWSFEDTIDAGDHELEVTAEESGEQKQSDKLPFVVSDGAQDTGYFISGGACSQVPGQQPSGSWLIMALGLCFIWVRRMRYAPNA